MTEQASYRQILRSTSIIGGATFITILIGFVRMKVFALVLGPVGIGLYGVLSTVFTVAATLAGNGLNVSGVRQIAAAETGSREQGVARASLWSLSWILAVSGAAFVWLARAPIARLATGSEAHAGAIGWTALAVALAVIANTQVTVLQGLRRMGALAGVKLWGAVLATIIGIAAVLLFGEAGIVAAIVAVPLAGVIAALFYRPGRSNGGWERPAALLAQWRMLAAIGSGFIITAILGSIVQLGARALIVNGDGLGVAGLYQAVWSASVMNVTLVLAAMSADYLPRLSGLANDPAAAGRLLNQQVRIALLLGRPLFVAMIAFAPLVLHLLFSSEFVAASGMFQWQMAGDAQKIVGWTLAFVFVARADMTRLVLAELGFSIAYLAGVSFATEAAALDGYGAAYFFAYSFYLAVLAVWCRRRHGIGLSRENFRMFAVLIAVALALIALTHVSSLAAQAAGALIAAGFALEGARRLTEEAGLGGLRGALLQLRLRLAR